MSDVYDLGEIVRIDPLQQSKGPEGRVVGITNYIDGSVGYTVVTRDLGTGGVARHIFSAHELSKIAQD